MGGNHASNDGCKRSLGSGILDKQGVRKEDIKAQGNYKINKKVLGNLLVTQEHTLLTQLQCKYFGQVRVLN